MADKFHYVCHEKSCTDCEGITNEFDVAMSVARMHLLETGHRTGVGIAE